MIFGEDLSGVTAGGQGGRYRPSGGASGRPPAWLSGAQRKAPPKRG